MLSDAEIKAMRVTIALTHTQDADVMRKISISDGTGGRVVTRQIASTIKVRLSTAPPARSQTVQLGGVMSEMAYLASFSASADVKADDLLVIAGTSYEVIGVHDQGNYLTHNRATLRRLSV